MDLYEINTHPFVVKIWLEETATEAGRATWRGHITHVPSGERRYFEELPAMIDFIQPYLREWGIGPSLCERVWSWVARVIDSG